MSYRGTEAARLDYVERAWEYGVTQRPRFDVVEGGGADARVRQGVTSGFMIGVQLIALIVAAFVLLGSVRVALTSATVNLLKSNLTVKAEIERAQDLNSALRIERSVLANTTRIMRIATENYGMVHVMNNEHVSVYTPEQIAEMQAAELVAQTSSTGTVIRPITPEESDPHVLAGGTTASGSVIEVTAQGARAMARVQSIAADLIAAW